MTQLQLVDSAGRAPTPGRVRFHRGPWQTMTLPERFVLIGDPPYGIDYESNFHLGHGRDASAVGSRAVATRCDGDGDTTERDSFMARGGWVAAAVFGPGDLLETPPWGKPRHVLIVDKGEGAGMGDLSFPWRPNYETVAIYGDGWAGKRTTSVLQSRVLGFGRGSASNGRRHPHEKDLRSVVALVSKAPAGLPIVDPWAGSGTTAEACLLLGRECYTAEVDPRYWPVVDERLAAVRGAS